MAAVCDTNSIVLAYCTEYVREGAPVIIKPILGVEAIKEPELEKLRQLGSYGI